MSETTFEREVLDRLIAIEEKLDGYHNAKVKTYENEKDIIQIKNDLDEASKRIASLEESNKWLTRTIAGALITAIVGILFAFVRLGAGI